MGRAMNLKTRLARLEARALIGPKFDPKKWVELWRQEQDEQITTEEYFTMMGFSEAQRRRILARRQAVVELMDYSETY